MSGSMLYTAVCLACDDQTDQDLCAICTKVGSIHVCPHCGGSSIECVEDRLRWVCHNCTAKFRSNGYVLGWADTLAEDAEYEHFEHYRAESNAQFDDFLVGEALS